MNLQILIKFEQSIRERWAFQSLILRVYNLSDGAMDSNIFTTIDSQAVFGLVYPIKSILISIILGLTIFSSLLYIWMSLVILISSFSLNENFDKINIEI
ncbi:hypothetical protein FGO68_gene11659 [Halteria grandinella]|uniref:Uncharacterized protein n=1 Tax=Halteria grandinella TaxID=5974 RepID=A0A8J8NFS0_HALGN|nr:hypothetical protein FGO68_gene11659 [Halteria grandinella]